MSETRIASRPAPVQAASSKAPRRPLPAHALALVRTAVYSLVATTLFLAMTVACSFVYLFPADRVRPFLIAWARADLWLLRVLVGQRLVVLGRENVPRGPALIASKHQSPWETLAFIPLLPKAAIILKKELLQIPIYGWYARFFGMVPVDRSAGAKALKQLAVDAGRALSKGMQIVIFPEGTRRSIGAPPDYKPGALFLYEKLAVPMVPVALNSGLLWPRGRYVKYPGTITVSFLPSIPPGRPRKGVRLALEEAIETETARLVAPAQAAAR